MIARLPYSIPPYINLMPPPRPYTAYDAQWDLYTETAPEMKHNFVNIHGRGFLEYRAAMTSQMGHQQLYMLGSGGNATDPSNDRKSPQGVLGAVMSAASDAVSTVASTPTKVAKHLMETYVTPVSSAATSLMSLEGLDNSYREAYSENFGNPAHDRLNLLWRTHETRPKDKDALARVTFGSDVTDHRSDSRGSDRKPTVEEAQLEESDAQLAKALQDAELNKSSNGGSSLDNLKAPGDGSLDEPSNSENRRRLERKAIQEELNSVNVRLRQQLSTEQQKYKRELMLKDMELEQLKLTNPNATPSPWSALHTPSFFERFARKNDSKVATSKAIATMVNGRIVRAHGAEQGAMKSLRRKPAAGDDDPPVLKPEGNKKPSGGPSGGAPTGNGSSGGSGSGDGGGGSSNEPDDGGYFDASDGDGDPGDENPTWEFAHPAIDESDGRKFVNLLFWLSPQMWSAYHKRLSEFRDSNTGDVFGCKDLRESIGPGSNQHSRPSGSETTNNLTYPTYEADFVEFKDITMLNLATFTNMRNRVWGWVTLSVQHLDPMIFPMFSKKMQETFIEQFHDLTTTALNESPWMLDGRIITGEYESEETISGMKYDRLLCIVMIIVCAANNEDETDIKMREVFKTTIESISNFPGGTQQMYQRYSHFDYKLNGKIEEIIQYTQLIQFQRQSAVQLQHKGNRAKYGVQMLLEASMRYLNADKIHEYLHLHSEYPKGTRKQGQKAVKFKTFEDYLTKWKRESNILSKNVSTVRKQLQLFQSQFKVNHGLNLRSDSQKTPTTSNTQTALTRNRVRRSRDTPITSQDLTKKKRTNFYVKPKDGLHHLQLMTGESYEALNTTSFNNYEIVVPTDEETWLNAFEVSHNKSTKPPDGKGGKFDPSAKRACIWQIHFGECWRANCPHEHAANKLISEKRLIVKKLQEELAKLPPERLHVMESQGAVADDDEWKPAGDGLMEDSDDDESAEFLKDVFGPA